MFARRRILNGQTIGGSVLLRYGSHIPQHINDKRTSSREQFLIKGPVNFTSKEKPVRKPVLSFVLPFISAAVLVATWGAQTPLKAQSRALPTVQATDLTGRAFSFPAGVSGDPALAIFTYRQEEQAEAARVRRLVQLASSDRPRMILHEFPVLAAPAVARNFIKSKMREGIPTNVDRTKIVPLFVQNLNAWRQATGFTDTRGVWLVRVSNGAIVGSMPSTAIKTEGDVRQFLAR